MKSQNPQHGGSSRIPLALQSIFLNGNRGKVVDVPPPGKAAMKVFKRWIWRDATSNVNTSKGCVDTASATESTVDDGYRYSDGKLVNSPKGKKSKKKKISIPSLSPQQYLDGIVFSRGYSSTIHSTLMTNYYNAPSQLQRASYGVYMISVIRDGDNNKLQELMEIGLSPNACNAYGESIVHTVCRTSDVKMLEVLLTAGCDVQTSDDNGRTPLHDACWAPEPNFDLVEKLLQKDVQMLYLADKHGHLPLSYTRQEQWDGWLQFLQSKKDVFWPLRSNGDVDDNAALELSTSKPNTRPILDPKHALSINVCKEVANGKINPSDIHYWMDLEHTELDSDDGDDDDDDDDDDDESYYDDDDDDESCSITNDEFVGSLGSDDLHESWNIHEMNDVLESISSPVKRPLAW